MEGMCGSCLFDPVRASEPSSLAHPGEVVVSVQRYIHKFLLNFVNLDRLFVGRLSRTL